MSWACRRARGFQPAWDENIMRTRQEELRQVIYTTQDVPGLFCSYETAIHYIHEAGIEKEIKPASKNLISPLRQ